MNLATTKRRYAGVMGMAWRRLATTRVGRSLERDAPRSRTRHWLRSLFAIHDLDQMVTLDVPWWTYSAIAEVERFLGTREGASVFEFGSGASTIWLAKRAGSVLSVEHDPSWHSAVASKLADCPTAHLMLVPAQPTATHPQPKVSYRSSKPGHEGLNFENYVRSIDHSDQKFDLIIVDGRARAGCVTHAIDRLHDGGMIVVDNSRRYRDTITSTGLRVERYSGLTPCLPYPDETTLLRHRE